MLLNDSQRGVVTSTYGRQALEQLRDVVRTAKADDAMATVTILLPNNIAGIVARRYLAREGLDEQRRGIAALKLGTLPRLAEQIAAPSLIHKRPATGPIVSAAWRAILDADPGLFKEVAAHRQRFARSSGRTANCGISRRRLSMPSPATASSRPISYVCTEPSRTGWNHSGTTRPTCSVRRPDSAPRSQESPPSSAS